MDRSDIPVQLAQLSPEERRLLERRLVERGLISGQTSSIAKRIPVRCYPLSFAQQRLWFLDQLDPGSAAYNVPSALRLSGPLNVAALEQSLTEIVRRHEALRTAFSMVEGQPVQLISPSSNLALQVMDLTGWGEREREAETQCLGIAEARKPFDLSQGPLVRVTLLRLREDDHVLLLTMHHIVSDGWSLGVFYGELSVLYEAFSIGKPSPLPSLPIQYADFALWQRERLQGEVLEEHLSYWKKQLEGIPAVINLPTDRPRPAEQSYRGARQSMQLSQDLTQALKALSRQHNVTLFMTLLAVFQILLQRYSGQDDIVVGSPIANRNRTELESLIGFFVNTLVLRSDLTGNPTVGQLLARVREVALGAYAHQDLPFERLVEELNPERDRSHAPLFQVMFVLQNAPVRKREFSGLSLDVMPIETGTAKFDLLLSMSETGGQLKASLEYSTDLFDAATVRRMLDHFRTLLAAIVAHPERRISDLPLLTEFERDQLLIEWNHTERDFPREKCVHELFEAQVERSPGSVALVLHDQRLTYRELNQRANRLARYLQTLGVGPRTLVGICVARSIEMVIGLLGILKAGGTYVPLDPDYPAERLAFMLADADAPVLLTMERLRVRFLKYKGRVLCLDKESQSISSQTEQLPASAVGPEHLAYVSYTSGSTGKPKAVAMSHRSLVNMLWWQLENFSHPAPARTLQLASLSFDVSFQEIFATFCSGGTLVLIPEALRRDPVGLLHYLGDQSVERLFVTFTALQQLAEAVTDGKPVPKSLREIITAGEQLHITPPIISLFHQLTDATFHNQYGPSESHVVTAFTLTGRPEAWPPLPSIGRPISNTQIFLLDPSLNPVPIGVCGELYIGGDGVARGYLHWPELTAEKFIPSPFSSEPGARLYKTGDLARYRSDGSIEFLGRTDAQVKIRGFRIELGEIESVLREHPGVLETVVAAREEASCGRRLVAYVVHRQGTPPSVSELRSSLSRKLPEYMIPSAFVVLDALPLTPNGKVDRKALPAPDQSRPELDQGYQAPRTPMEEMLAKIWAEVLKVEKVGIHDNFFDLGGHSLLATQVISRLRVLSQIEVTVRALFEKPTIADLTSAILAQQAETLDGGDLAGMLADIEECSEKEAEGKITEGNS